MDLLGPNNGTGLTLYPKGSDDETGIYDFYHSFVMRSEKTL